MSFPGFARRLFQNEGAGPLLRKEIIPETITKDDILNISQDKIDRYFSKGCKIFFQQDAAPSGWKKVTTYNDCALRLVNGTPGNRTNGTAFSACFAAGRGTSAVQISMGTYNTTLNSGQIGSHSHGAWHAWAHYSYNHGAEDYDEGGGHYSTTYLTGTDALNTGRDGGSGGDKYARGDWSDNVIGWAGNNSGAHSHGTWNNAHSHAVDLNVNYVDVILCERT